MLNKKAEWGWEEISKIIIILVVLIILILLALTFKENTLKIIEKIKDVFNAKK